jgi:hypothetical protein
MTDTAQPLAAESDGIAEAANAFKIALGQADAPVQARDETGKFAAVEPEAEEPEAEDDTDLEPIEQDDAQADADEGGDADDDEAAEEAQLEGVEMPASWGKEQADHWETLPPETQAFIAEREGERERAVNAKFQEAANVRRAHESAFTEAQNSRLEYTQAIDQVIGLIGNAPEPPLTMLDINSSDYDPDRFHLLKAQYDQTNHILGSLHAQRQNTVAQQQAAQRQMDMERFQQIQEATKPAFIKDVPEITDQAKTTGILQELIDYAVKSGASPEMFDTPTTALEWHMIWKAKQYDRLQEAKAKVAGKPAPEPRKPQPAVRPGVTTPRAAIQQARRQKDFARLKSSGSIEDGAAVFKHFLKGK